MSFSKIYHKGSGPKVLMLVDFEMGNLAEALSRYREVFSINVDSVNDLLAFLETENLYGVNVVCGQVGMKLLKDLIDAEKKLGNIISLDANMVEKNAAEKIQFILDNTVSKADEPKGSVNHVELDIGFLSSGENCD